MKKIIALALIAILCLSFFACAKEETTLGPDEFVKLDEATIATAVFSDNKGTIDTEKMAAIVSMYNNTEISGAFDTEAVTLWTLNIVCTDQSIYNFSYIGENTFNIKVTNGETVSHYQAVNEPLFAAINSYLPTIYSAQRMITE